MLQHFIRRVGRYELLFALFFFLPLFEDRQYFWICSFENADFLKFVQFWRIFLLLPLENHLNLTLNCYFCFLHYYSPIPKYGCSFGPFDNCVMWSVSLFISFCGRVSIANFYVTYFFEWFRHQNSTWSYTIAHNC